MPLSTKKLVQNLLGSSAYKFWEERVRRIIAPGSQSRKAADYWATLVDCEGYYNDPIGRTRSEWIADQVEALGIESLLEIGTNSGRNLAVVGENHPDIILKGTDINEMAIRYAREKNPYIEFAVADANRWEEPDKSWDAICTMSLIDHIPEEAIQLLAKNMVRTARKYIICVELWDGTDGWRGLYKYSRDLRKVFERLGVKTVSWAPSVGQYNSSVSLLHSYIGEVEGAERYTDVTKAKSRTVAVGTLRYPIQEFIDNEGRKFHYVHISRPETGRLLIHFTAFFGDWGDRKEYQAFYKGYFHRLRMFGDAEDYGSLFLCDEFGHTSNGTYYTGQDGDFFVERAIEAIIKLAIAKDGLRPENVVMAGSSMGATGALKFGLLFNVRAIVAISPHIDLDTSAKTQGRMEHVRFLVPDNDPLSPNNFEYTRQIANILNSREGVLPRLFMHACADDHGVYQEQVLPLARHWREKGGAIDLDIRPDGGHTSAFATKSMLQDVVLRLFEGGAIEPLTYRQSREFWPKSSTPEGKAETVPAENENVELQKAIKSNSDTLVLAATFLIDRVRTRNGALLSLAFASKVDDSLLASLKKDPVTEDIDAFVLGDEQLSGPKPLILVLICAFYGITRTTAQELLAKLPYHFEGILIVDQTDNIKGDGSVVLTLHDSGNREYTAECHDFGNLLKEVGYLHSLNLAFPQPSKSATGVILVDSREPIALTDLKIFWRHRQTFDLGRYRGTQAGQFLIPSCSEGGARIRAFLRNTYRLGENVPLELRRLGIAVELRIFRNGKLIAHEPLFARVGLDSIQEISDSTCEALRGDQTGILVVARCYLPSDGPTYFSQEHQLCYVHERTGSFCSVLYDQLPVVPSTKEHSPIVLLAPKAWVGIDHNTYVTFPSTNSSFAEGEQCRPLEITVLNSTGQRIVSVSVPLLENSVHVFNVKQALKGKITFCAEPELFNVVAKGGAGSFAIVTFVLNERTGNIALEHSLSPHYYTSKGLDVIRREALSFDLMENADVRATSR